MLDGRSRRSQRRCDRVDAGTYTCVFQFDDQAIDLGEKRGPVQGWRLDAEAPCEVCDLLFAGASGPRTNLAIAKGCQVPEVGLLSGMCDLRPKIFEAQSQSGGDGGDVHAAMQHCRHGFFTVKLKD